MWEMSFANLMLLSAAIPVYKSKSEKDEKEKAVDGFDELEELLNN